MKQRFSKIKPKVGHGKSRRIAIVSLPLAPARSIRLPLHLRLIMSMLTTPHLTGNLLETGFTTSEQDRTDRAIDIIGCFQHTSATHGRQLTPR